MSSVLIRNARLVNEGRKFDADLLVDHGRIAKIASSIEGENATLEIDANGQWLLPGMIDDQVHFRDPGAPNKGSIHTESRAAVAGGITSFMDMPNTRPATLTLDALAEKKRRAATTRPTPGLKNSCPTDRHLPGCRWYNTALPALLELVADQLIPLTTLVAKTSHRVADLFAIPDRGYLREGYWADLVLIKPEPAGKAVSRQPILAQCGWTPFAGQRFRHSVSTTLVSGQIAWHAASLYDNCRGLPLGSCAKSRFTQWL